MSYNYVGNVRVAQGKLAGELKSYRDSLAILDRLYLDWELLARRGFTRIRYSRLQ